MADKYKVFNKVKINVNRYEELEVNNNDKLKSIMKDKLNSSERVKNKKQKNKMILTVAASLVAVVIGLGITNPSLADNFIKNINEFKTMLDKIKESVDAENTTNENMEEYDPSRYPEIEAEKKEHKDSKLIATPIGIKSKSEGIEISLNKAMYDKKKIYLDMTVKTDMPIKESDIMKAISESPYGDGQINMYMSVSEMYINEIKQDGFGYGPGIVEFVDEHTASFSYLIDLSTNNNIEDANFNIKFGISKYQNNELSFENIKGDWNFAFNIKAVDDNKKRIDINKKDGDYILNKVEVTDTYVEVELELPTAPSLGNPHNNFIIVLDENGKELQMTQGIEGKTTNYIYELENIGQELKYIDILVVKDYMDMYEPSKVLSKFRVDLSQKGNI